MKIFKIPVLLIVYNRLDTLTDVIDSLRKISPLKLYVSSDGPKANNSNDIRKVDDVRNYLKKSINWDCEVKFNYRSVNEGLKKGVIQGIDWFFENEEYGIILEDDIIANETFFLFSEEHLQRFKNDYRLMMITGNNFLGSGIVKEDYYFSSIAIIWGWATWRRAWNLMDVEMVNYNENFIKELSIKSKTNWVYRHHKYLFDYGKNVPLNTWDIPWYFSVLYNNGLVLVPKYNLCMNIGSVGTNYSGKTSGSLFMETKDYEFSSKDPVIVHHNVLYDFWHHKKMHKKGVYIRLVIDIIIWLKLFPIYKLFRQLLSRIGIWDYGKS